MVFLLVIVAAFFWLLAGVAVNGYLRGLYGEGGIDHVWYFGVWVLWPFYLAWYAAHDDAEEVFRMRRRVQEERERAEHEIRNEA
jgi:hypothetical protein